MHNNLFAALAFAPVRRALLFRFVRRSHPAAFPFLFSLRGMRLKSARRRLLFFLLAPQRSKKRLTVQKRKVGSARPGPPRRNFKFLLNRGGPCGPKNFKRFTRSKARRFRPASVGSFGSRLKRRRAFVVRGGGFRRGVCARSVRPQAGCFARIYKTIRRLKPISF